MSEPQDKAPEPEDTTPEPEEIEVVAHGEADDDDETAVAGCVIN
jgi:hypothetical protein